MSTCVRWLVIPLLASLAGLADAQTIETRSAVIARAQVWRATNIGAADLWRGPAQAQGPEPGETITCDFVQRTFEGTSPKFACILPTGEEVKIKFGETNTEVHGEVAATRLLWALGFGADIMSPVRVICRGCPDAIGENTNNARERLVDSAVVERKLPEPEYPFPAEGWSWLELDRIDEDAGGAPLAHRDALKLLAVFIQHTDSKPEQQRLVCLDRTKDDLPVSCRHPLMMLDDVGLTFGRAHLTNANYVAGMNLREWSHTPVWKEGAACLGNLPKSLTGTLKDPVISEDGRKFLAGLLTQLSDAQLRGMFKAARVNDVDEWVGAFKAKRKEIVDRRCDVLWPGGIATLFGTTPVLWLQGHATTGLTGVMNVISLLGYTLVYLAVGVALAFLVHLRAGAALLLLLALNGVLTDAAKAVVNSPRPAAVDSRVLTLSAVESIGDSFRTDSLPSVDADDGYGFPSGHVSSATAFLFGLMYLFGWRWVWRLMAVWIPAMALSRLYLGRHFLGDVLGGVGIGVIAAAIGFLALTLARLSNPARARTTVIRSILAGAFLIVCALVIHIPAAYDAGRFMGLALGAGCVVAYIDQRFAPASEIPMRTRIGSVATAAMVLALSWWGTRVVLAATDLSQTPVGAVLSGALPMLVLLPLPLYLADRLFVKRAVGVRA